jgi:MOSC domain-containing protein YiiM
VRIRHLLLSAGHNYFGHHQRPPGTHPMREVDRVECIAGGGLRGDRFFNYKTNYKGQVTFFSWEVFNQLRYELNAPDAQPAGLRRNVISEGVDLNLLIGQDFEVQGMRFHGVEECRPCYWMDQAIAPGAEAWLKGRGGLRCRILSSGWLHRNDLSMESVTEAGVTRSSAAH